MLTLLHGSDRTSLTQRVFEQIGKAAECGEQGQILIVPEQFSHEAERRLCEVGGDPISRFAEVLSLTRLSDRLASIYGGAARPYLDKGGQLLTMALAAEQVSSRIKYYASALRKPEFLVDMLRIIGEFQSYCLEPDMLMEASRKLDGQFSLKLEELGLLYGAYLAVCANVAADPSDKLARLRDQLAEHNWADGRSIYIDGFSDFTGAELEVLDQLTGCARVVITVPTGPVGSALERRAEEHLMVLKRRSEKLGHLCVVQEVPGNDRRNPCITEFLEKLFTSDRYQLPEFDPLHLLTCASVEDECKYVVLRVKELLSQGVRCREISVACTDLEKYEAPLLAAFRTAEIPFYLAGEVDILAKPVVGAVLNSLFAAVGPMEYEDVSVYLKSGLPELERDMCDRLDNYAYLWNLRGTQWENVWTRHPRGFGEVWTDEDRLELERLNTQKEQAMGPLIAFRKRMLASGNTGDMVLAVYSFMEMLQLRQRLEQQANAFADEGNRQLSQELLQVYDTLLSALEQIWATLRETNRTPEDFCRFYQMLLTRYRIATIPAGLDQIHISDLPDLRHRQTKHLLVLGAADGLFPVYKSAEGLLTEDERKRLVNHGISMAPSRADQIELEMLKICHALFAAEESLCISYSGEQPAWLFRRASELLNGTVRRSDTNVCLDLDSLAALRLRMVDRSEIEHILLQDKEEELRKAVDYRFDPLAERTVKGLYGSPVMLSPSKIDLYAACRFEYFLQYGLKAKPRKQAKLDQPAFGTFVHAVMEHTVLAVQKLGGFQVVSKEQVIKLAVSEIDRYAKEHFPEQAEREAYLFRRSYGEILEIVEDLWEELRASRFSPAYCELRFANDGPLPLIHIKTDRTDCRITGTIDRVDLFEDHDRTYVRVVDYKTGRKDFDYTDILSGAGLQMLIYLFALREFGGDHLKIGRLEPAGVLYLPARKDYPLTEPMPDDSLVQKEHREIRKRKGLIRCEEHILAAMEADPYDPQYMPYQYGKKGFSGDLADQRQMSLLERHVVRSIEAMADAIVGGAVSPNPVVRGQHTPCRYCDYRTVCHKDLGTQESRNLSETSAKLFWEKLEQEEQEHG